MGPPSAAKNATTICGRVCNVEYAQCGEGIWSPDTLTSNKGNRMINAYLMPENRKMIERGDSSGNSVC